MSVLTEYSSSSQASKGPFPLERFWRTKGHWEPGTSSRKHSLAGVLAKTRGEVWVKIPMLSRARNRRKSAEALVLVRLASSSTWSGPSAKRSGKPSSVATASARACQKPTTIAKICSLGADFVFSILTPMALLSSLCVALKIEKQLNRSFIPPIIPKPSSLLCYPPELFHQSDKIFCRFDARRKLRANDDLRRAEFPRCRHVFGNLLEGSGKIPVF